jgi:allophanate hydrolase
VAELEADPIGPNSRLGTYTNFVNLLGLCGLTVPTPPRADGRPGSVTLLAPSGRDGLLAALGTRIECWDPRRLGATPATLPPPEAPAMHAAQAEPEEIEIAVCGAHMSGLPLNGELTRLGATPATLPPPEAPEVHAGRAGPEEIEIAVCGAHMSGLPLNGELTRLGARFLRAAETVAAYRLYSLPGGPPRRPGMVRVAGGRGAAISVEVWALPRAAFGTFMGGIPAPLSIGTVELADGTAPKGFLCEAAGTAGAVDVSAFGDWRRVLEASAA